MSSSEFQASSSKTSSRPVVLVTGAAGGGIGTCTATRFAEAGWDIVATDIKPLESVQKSVEELGAACLAIHLDVTKSDSVQTGITKALERFGRIDCLVNNAAASLGSGLHDCSEKLWDASIELTLKSVFLLSKAVLPSMMERKSGVIINIASVNGQTGIGEEAYSAAKAGVINLTQNMAVRYGPHGIRAVCIAPGTIETHLWKERLAKNPKTLENLKKYYPLGRIGQGRDVANAAYFLASPEASWISGTTLNVDGGFMAGSSQLQRDLMGE